MNSRQLHKDLLWWAALSGGPFFWLALWFWGVDVQPLERLGRHLPALALIALVYPVLEEIVFRGAIQEWLNSRLPDVSRLGISLPNLVTSLLFTALHFIHQAPLWAASVFLPSLVFGFFKERYQSLLPPILLHVFYNTGYALLFLSF